MKDKLDLNLLRVFSEVYRLNSITLAAESLGTTQPAVSGMLKRLTLQLGEQLFLREGRGISPSNVAIQLAQEIDPHLAAIASSIVNLKQFDASHPRTFKIFAAEPMLLLLLPLIDDSSRLGNCNIELIIAPATQETLLEQLSLQQVDLAIDIGASVHNSFECTPFHQERVLICCSKKHKTIQGKISLEQFYQSTHIGIKMRRYGHHAIRELSKVPLQDRKIAANCDSIISGLALASSSQVLCITPQSISDNYADIFNLQTFPLPFDTHPIEHYMIWHKRTNQSAAHQWLRSTLMSMITDIEAVKPDEAKRKCKSALMPKPV